LEGEKRDERREKIEEGRVKKQKAANREKGQKREGEKREMRNDRK
jgi:hypothetical protein